ncbi:acyltransferase family protein [Paracoccus marinaquae]|uniref:Acyltransferase n=1 Tax=Paracoccus marinaquae TaxID=2841926 RepID=A0ABS6AQB4_9RHOB|nr:acyltransferase [Paracoccus marinaquae]MBU3031671.1 acyltransferase [Paracoccus marinaquae]
MAETSGQAPLAPQLDLLTAIRFFAAAWVFFFHFWSWVGLPDTGLWALAGSGARGVDLFFVLSGFVIYHVYGGRETGGGFDFGTYMWRRFARVYPMHLVMLLVWLVFLLAVARLGYQADRAPTLRDGIASLLMIHSWRVTDGLILNGVSWSISAEMSAYLAFGLLMVISPRRPGWVFWTVVLVVSGVVAHLVARADGYAGFMHPTWDLGVLRIFPAFALGVLTRMLAERVGPRPAALIGAVAMVAFLVVARNPNADYALLPIFAGLILAAARLSPTLGQSSLVGRRVTGVLVYLGEISYSTYLVHSLILIVYSNLGPRFPAYWEALPLTVHSLVCFALVILASAISYHMVELPGRSWLNGIWTRRRARAGIARETG